jgi:hypothetical protein
MSIGLVYEKIGFMNEAVFLWARVIEMFPWHEGAKSKICECQGGVRSPFQPLELPHLDITEFPFHKNMQQFRHFTVTSNEIVAPKPVYSNQPISGLGISPSLMAKLQLKREPELNYE